MYFVGLEILIFVNLSFLSAVFLKLRIVIVQIGLRAFARLVTFWIVCVSGCVPFWFHVLG